MTGLSVNTTKTKIMYMNAQRAPNVIINGEELENVNEFTYPESVINSNNGAVVKTSKPDSQKPMDHLPD